MKKSRRSNRKDKSSISIGRVERLIGQIMSRGLFLIRGPSTEGETLVVTGAEARRLGYHLNSFEIHEDKNLRIFRIQGKNDPSFATRLQGLWLVERRSQPRPVVRKLEELEKFKAVFVFDGALHPNENSKGVFAPNEEEKELMRKGPAGKANRLRGSHTQGKSKNQAHRDENIHDSKGWKQSKMKERNPDHWAVNSNR